jgi:hypothetical protein
MPLQRGWRHCRNCNLLYYGPGPRRVNCPSIGVDAHDGSQSPEYMVYMEGDATPYPAQPVWRRCKNCEVMSYHALGSGWCSGGPDHDGDGVEHYAMMIDNGTAPPRYQRGWRRCLACEGLVLAGVNPLFPFCGAQGNHYHRLEGSDPYVVILA